MATKFRYLIEMSGDESFPFHATSVDVEGQAQGSGRDFVTLDEAKSYLEDNAQSGDEDAWGEKVALVWKDPPAAWKPDAVCVSQYLTEMYETNPA